MVIAFGTAGVPTEVSKNGGIVIGSGVFPHDAQKTDVNKRYENKLFGQFVPSSVNAKFFDLLNLGMSKLSSKLYFEISALPTLNHPNKVFPFYADPAIVAIPDMNTNSYDDFKIGDAAALKEFTNFKKQHNLQQIVYSVDTTHALVRLECGTEKFIFISAITDRLAYFDSEVTPNVLAQNYSASFNGGVLLGWFIPFLWKELMQEL